MVAERSAIQLEAGKEYLIESRLETLARTEGLSGAAAIVDAIKKSPSGPMANKLIEAMTTNETSFFRDRLPFDALRDSVLPGLIAARSSVRRLNIWCGAASTGQEPYSIALTIREHFPELTAWNVKIVATDISNDVLEKARSGRYSQLEVNRGLPAEMLVRHFERDGSRWKLRSNVRDMVEFRELNLVGAWPVLPKPDIVFLRNVMIYFDVASKQKILAKISGMLARDGYLFLGAGETTLNLDSSFRRLELDRAGCFQLVGSPNETSPLTALEPKLPPARGTVPPAGRPATMPAAAPATAPATVGSRFGGSPAAPAPRVAPPTTSPITRPAFPRPNESPGIRGGQS